MQCLNGRWSTSVAFPSKCLESSDGCYLDEIGGKETVNVEGREGGSGPWRWFFRCSETNSSPSFVGLAADLPIDLLCGISGDCRVHHLSHVACKKNADDDVCARGAEVKYSDSSSSLQVLTLARLLVYKHCVSLQHISEPLEILSALRLVPWCCGSCHLQCRPPPHRRQRISCRLRGPPTLGSSSSPNFFQFQG